MKELVVKLAKEHGFTLSEILGRQRNARVVNARWSIMRTLRDKGLSFPKIAKLMKKHHTTVMHACKHGWREERRESNRTRYI